MTAHKILPISQTVYFCKTKQNDETHQHKECCNYSGFVEHLFDLVEWTHQETRTANDTARLFLSF